MNWNKFLVAGVVGAVITVGFGFLWHVPLFGSVYAESRGLITRPEVMRWTPALGEIFRGFLLALIYPIGFQGGTPLREGLRFGVVMGLLISTTPLIYYGVYNFSAWTWFWLELIGITAQCAIAGIAIAYVYGAQGGKAR